MKRYWQWSVTSMTQSMIAKVQRNTLAPAMLLALASPVTLAQIETVDTGSTTTAKTEAHFGVITLGEPSCLEIDVDLDAGTEIWAVDVNAQKFFRATVVTKTESDSCRPPNRGVRELDKSYTLSHEPGDAGRTGLAVAGAGAELAAFASGDELQDRLRGDPEPFLLKRCTSSEGILFSVLRMGARIWRAYYYVAYDMEPNCPEER
jgi:hypothetical protein